MQLPIYVCSISHDACQTGSCHAVIWFVKLALDDHAIRTYQHEVVTSCNKDYVLYCSSQLQMYTLQVNICWCVFQLCRVGFVSNLARCLY